MEQVSLARLAGASSQFDIACDQSGNAAYSDNGCSNMGIVSMGNARVTSNAPLRRNRTDDPALIERSGGEWKNYARFRQLFSVLVSRNVLIGGGIPIAALALAWALLVAGH